MPRDTHVWQLFIKSKELNEYLLNAGFSPQEMTGFAPSFSPSALVNAAWSHRNDLYLAISPLDWSHQGGP